MNESNKQSFLRRITDLTAEIEKTDKNRVLLTFNELQTAIQTRVLSGCTIGISLIANGQKRLEVFKRSSEISIIHLRPSDIHLRPTKEAHVYTDLRNIIFWTDRADEIAKITEAIALSYEMFVGQKSGAQIYLPYFGDNDKGDQKSP